MVNQCRCGCGSAAVFIVRGTEYGKPFTEWCCRSAADYLRECAAEAGDECRLEAITRLRGNYI